MTAWCFNNNFKAPPLNFPAPKPIKECTWSLDQWCSSKDIASTCGVSLTQYFQK